MAEVTNLSLASSLYADDIRHSQKKASQRLSPNWNLLYPQEQTDLSFLDQPFSPQEITDAVFGLHPEKSPGKKDVCAIKVDFYKAFDCVNWSFLLSLLEARGFGPKWCSWIHNIISSSKSAVLVNGTPTSFFKCFKGLKQGDPLSPLLFLLVADVLSQMLRCSAASGDLSNLNLRGNLNSIRTIQFADDTIIFSRANPSDMVTLKTILSIFASISGLCANHQKSNLFYLGKIPQKGNSMAEILGCTVGSLPFSYLGLPLKRGTLTKREWQPLLESFKKKLSIWKNKTLSIGGRLTLLNSVLSSIPLYYMSFFKLPKWVINAVDKIRRKFLWNGSHSFSRAKFIVNWGTVCKSKEEGGLGVIDIPSFNSALLSKWIWKLLDRPSYLSKVFFSIYSKNGANPLATQPKMTSSRFLQDLFAIQSTFFKIARWNVGNGNTASFWHDKWSSTNSLSSLYPHAYKLALSKNCSIGSQGRWTNDSWCWHPLIRRGISPKERADVRNLHSHLENISLGGSQEHDVLHWPLLSTGIFSVKSFYSFVSSGGQKSKFFNMIWKSSIPLKVKVHLWIISKRKLNTKDILIKKGWSGDPLCPLCLGENETHDHIFIHCPFAREVWKFLLPSFPANNWPLSTEDLLLLHIVPNISPDIKAIWKILLPCFCWRIWFCRNSLVFKDIQLNPMHTASDIARFSMFWTGSGDDRTVRRLRRAALNLGLQELAKKNIPSEEGGNSVRN
ncbi:uncharacterized protein LOC109842598 [Asparagus officinalis]|uniref:uncharacterized protein LOC109842598 n=1 Tax=Asparagus officinalis TaxID=4686 RepID=UPI00098E50E2|nr:uncharacterized protein LOC109842598 [Asparagus officinalis]